MDKTALLMEEYPEANVTSNKVWQIHYLNDFSTKCGTTLFAKSLTKENKIVKVAVATLVAKTIIRGGRVFQIDEWNQQSASNKAVQVTCAKGTKG